MNQITQRFGLYQLIFGWMNFVLIIPNIYLLLGLPLTMREYGWSGTDIGIFQLAGLPAVLKFLLALPVQRFSPGKRHYSHWILLLVLVLIFLLYLIGEQGIQGMLARRGPLFLFAFSISLLSTWVDIPLNALTVKLLPRSEQMRAGSIRSMAIFLGGIVGSGFMLVLQGRWGWQAPFYIMSVGLLLGLLLMGLLKEEKQNGELALQRNKQSIMDLSGYFRQPGAKLWTWLLMTSFPFIGAVWLYLKPMLLDLGVEAKDVAWIVGVGGGIVGAISSLLSGRLVRYLGVGRAIPSYLLAALLTLIALTVSVSLKLDQRWVIASIFLVAISMGAISSLMFGLMMLFTRHQRRASDYGVQASLFVMTRLTFPIGAGILLDAGGYSLMFTGLSCGVLLVLIIALLSRKQIYRMVEYMSQLSLRDR